MNFLKEICHSVKNTVLRDFTERLKPRWVWFEVTDRCNSHCVHCNIWRKKPTSSPLTVAEIEHMFRDPLFSDMEYILNSGGEAVMRDDLEAILLAEHRALPNAKLHLSTNGIWAERVLAVANTMVENNIPLEVGISLDGIGDLHDRVRGTRGNFEKTDWLLRQLVSLRKKTNNMVRPLLGLTLTDLTVGSFQSVKEYAQKMDVPFSAQWYNQSSFYDNEGKGRQNLRANREIEAVVRSLPCTLLNLKWEDWLKGKPIAFPCFALYTFFVLKCNGDMVSCLTGWDNTIGNVREHSPTMLWHNAAARKYRGVVRRCSGCLNSWGVDWSATASSLHALAFSLSHSRLFIKKFRKTFRHT